MFLQCAVEQRETPWEPCVTSQLTHFVLLCSLGRSQLSAAAAWLQLLVFLVATLNAAFACNPCDLPCYNQKVGQTAASGVMLTRGRVSLA
jgi:hypothetical protein